MQRRTESTALSASASVRPVRPHTLENRKSKSGKRGAAACSPALLPRGTDDGAVAMSVRRRRTISVVGKMLQLPRSVRRPAPRSLSELDANRLRSSVTLARLCRHRRHDRSQRRLSVSQAHRQTELSSQVKHAEQLLLYLSQLIIVKVQGWAFRSEKEKGILYRAGQEGSMNIG